MKLSATQINNLKVLLRGETLAWSALNEHIRQTLIEEQLITTKTHGSRKVIYAPSVEALQVFLEQHYDQLRGFDWDNAEIKKSATRAELATKSGNSKTQTIRSCPGFLVNSYDIIEAKLNDKDLTIAPQDGTMIFISDWEHFVIPSDVLIVGVENMENFRQIRKQKYLFPTNYPILFVSRYPQSADLREWLIRIPNQYLHFGDFDLAGMHIYETEFYKYLGSRASFFVPDDIEVRLQNGSAERYNAQYMRFRNYKPTDQRLMALYNIIQKYHCCYDQEGYIGK